MAANGSLLGKTALVTGAAKRIGREIALALAREGADVIVHYHRSEEEAAQLCQELHALGVKSWALGADFSVRSQYEEFVQRALAFTGKLDCLINNASIFPRDDLKGVTFESVVANMEVNAWTPFVLSRSFARSVDRGAIVNLLDSRTSGAYDWTHVGYILSKQVLTMLTRMCALEFAPRVRVNGIAPGLILPPPGKPQSYLDERVDTVPLKRHGDPIDIAQAAVYLLSAPFVTGSVIYVDGGRHLQEYPHG